MRSRREVTADSSGFVEHPGELPRIPADGQGEADQEPLRFEVRRETMAFQLFPHPTVDGKATAPDAVAHEDAQGLPAGRPMVPDDRVERRHGISGVAVASIRRRCST